MSPTPTFPVRPARSRSRAITHVTQRSLRVRMLNVTANGSSTR
jgi:hypothetical protein